MFTQVIFYNGGIMATFMSCRAQEIIELNKRKEYTLTATPLLDLLLSDPNLTSQSSKLWQLLFNKARFNPELEIKISYKTLGEQLNKSTRTIQRYITTLVNLGYLVISNNYKNDGGQTVNTIFVRFPKHKISLAKSTKDRVKTTQIKPEENQNVFLNTTNEYENVIACPQEMLNTKQVATSNVGVKIDVEGDDKNVVHYNNIINNNNNNVGSFFQESNSTEIENTKTETIPDNSSNVENETKSIKEQLEATKQLLTQAIIQYNAAKQRENTGDVLQRYNTGRAISALEGEKTHFEQKIEYLTKALLEKQNTYNLQDSIINDPCFIANKPGERRVEPSIFSMLTKKLSAYGVDGSNKNRLINEILLESRFGSLVKSCFTKQEMSIENSVNIALKLVRENRWKTPLLMQQQVLNACG
jgi:hypothetical protein